LPIGMTKKPLGDQRIPRSTDIPRQNPGSIQVKAANRLGVPPGQLTQAPGLQPQASSTPRPQAVPIRAPAVPRPAPEQMPPIPAPTLPQEPVPLPRARPDIPVPSVENRLADAIAAKYGVERIPIPENAPPPVVPSSGWLAASKPAPPSPFPSVSAPAQAAPAIVSAPVVPPITPQTLVAAVAAANQARDSESKVPSIEDRLNAEISKRYDSASNASPSATSQAPSAPPSAPPQKSPDPTQAQPPGKYTPSEGQFAGYYQRPAEGKDAPKLKEPKALKKGNSFYYYDILGVPRGDNVMAARALSKLRQKAIEEPQNLTQQEDRLLAASGSTDAFNLSMEPAAVIDRFKGYQAGGGDSKPSGKWSDRPDTAPTTGNTFKNDPAAALATKTIDNAGKKAPSKAPVDETPPTKAEDDTED
jgi:hypothetical protein